MARSPGHGNGGAPIRDDEPDTATVSPTSPEGGNHMSHSTELLLDLHRRMVRIRLFEEAAGSLAEAAKLPGFLHLYVGQEAVAAGVCAALTDKDQITSTHRGHGHLVAKGGDFNKMMAELMAKSTGYCKGKGGSMHISDCLLYTSPSPRDLSTSRMPSSA